MTLAKRISVARTLTIIQMVIPLFFLAIGFALGIFMFLSNPGEIPMPMIGTGIFLVIIAIIITIGLPYIVLMALKKRQEQWATAAFVSLIVQSVCGGGLLSLLPIMTLILLLNKEASAYIGMK